jgi:hypothetical protein
MSRSSFVGRLFSIAFLCGGAVACMAVSDLGGRVKGNIEAADGRVLTGCVVAVLKDGRHGQEIGVEREFDKSIGVIDGRSTYQFIVSCDGMEQYESQVFALDDRKWVADLGKLRLHPKRESNAPRGGSPGPKTP